MRLDCKRRKVEMSQSEDIFGLIAEEEK